ncbi:hypothetical protein J6590_044456 [Homalodisca vitripennis]|nr:hypothetical protein J6590_044456 [Homalodisca vitripennis]
MRVQLAVCRGASTAGLLHCNQSEALDVVPHRLLLKKIYCVGIRGFMSQAAIDLLPSPSPSTTKPHQSITPTTTPSQQQRFDFIVYG